ncbi:MAG: class I tRNA ligase family protein, partial [Nitrososphaeraceae archaeon]|nr:class I tRNA ligase family protein [Nitrososphaeraceae archaeon]
LHDKKISKSRNWYIGLRDFISIFNPDYLRFYIASISPSNQDDINFDWDMFYNKINNELIDNIGNFINRTLTFTNKNFGGNVPTPGEYDYEDKLGIDEITKLPREVGLFLEKTETDKALKNILKFSNYFNQYFQKKEPWKDKKSAHTTIYLSINAVRSLSIMLEPFLPFSVGEVYLQLFGKDTSNVIAIQKWDDAAKLNIKPGHQIQSNIKPLFKKIDKKQIEKEKSKLGSN